MLGWGSELWGCSGFRSAECLSMFTVSLLFYSLVWLFKAQGSLVRLGFRFVFDVRFLL